jgi:acetyl-CoA carboxylase biotin carboxylase subunit
LQLRIAAGEKLGMPQEDISWRGAAIECRVYAEDPDRNFMPSPGRIERLAQPSGPGIRLDSGIFEGFTVPMDYDPLLAKLAVWAGTREEAIARMSRALDEFHISGIYTNLNFFRRLLQDRAFQEGDLHTGFIDAFLARDRPPEPGPELREIAALAAAIHAGSAKPQAQSASSESRWRSEGRDQLFR